MNMQENCEEKGDKPPNRPLIQTSGKAGFLRWMDGTVAKSMCEEAALEKNCDGPLWAAGDCPKRHYRPQNL